MRAHCSPWAPGGVSQRTCQSLCTDLTAPCAAARSLGKARAAIARTTVSSDLIVRKTVLGVSEPIITSVPRSRAPRRSVWSNQALRPESDAAIQIPVKQRIVAEKGSNDGGSAGMVGGLFIARQTPRRCIATAPEL